MPLSPRSPWTIRAQEGWWTAGPAACCRKLRRVPRLCPLQATPSASSSSSGTGPSSFIESCPEDEAGPSPRTLPLSPQPASASSLPQEATPPAAAERGGEGKQETAPVTWDLALVASWRTQGAVLRRLSEFLGSKCRNQHGRR
jgi:hypothetical protein